MKLLRGVVHYPFKESKNPDRYKRPGEEKSDNDYGEEQESDVDLNKIGKDGFTKAGK